MGQQHGPSQKDGVQGCACRNDSVRHGLTAPCGGVEGLGGGTERVVFACARGSGARVPCREQLFAPSGPQNRGLLGGDGVVKMVTAGTSRLGDLVWLSYDAVVAR